MLVMRIQPYHRLIDLNQGEFIIPSSVCQIQEAVGQSPLLGRTIAQNTRSRIVPVFLTGWGKVNPGGPQEFLLRSYLFQSHPEYTHQLPTRYTIFQNSAGNGTHIFVRVPGRDLL